MPENPYQSPKEVGAVPPERVHRSYVGLAVAAMVILALVAVGFVVTFMVVSAQYKAAAKRPVYRDVRNP